MSACDVLGPELFDIGVARLQENLADTVAEVTVTASKSGERWAALFAQWWQLEKFEELMRLELKRECIVRDFFDTVFNREPEYEEVDDFCLQHFGPKCCETIRYTAIKAFCNAALSLYKVAKERSSI